MCMNKGTLLGKLYPHLKASVAVVVYVYVDYVQLFMM